MRTFAPLASLAAALIASTACSEAKTEPPPGELEKFVNRIDAKAEAEHAELVEASRAREDERARQSEERLRQLQKARPETLESAVKSMNR